MEQVREDSVCAVYFLPASESLSRWLRKLPPSYDLPPTSASASSIMLTVDSEGVLKLLRVTVSKKAPNPNSSGRRLFLANTQPIASQDLSLSAHVDSIAEWTLAKLPGDAEKWLTAAHESAQADDSKTGLNSPQWEPESV